MSTSPISPALRAILASLTPPPLIAAKMISLPVPSGACPEELGYELRAECAEKCAGRWQQVKMGTSLSFEFEDLQDAIEFRLRH
jgi:hypothetical protein